MERDAAFPECLGPSQALFNAVLEVSGSHRSLIALFCLTVILILVLPKIE